MPEMYSPSPSVPLPNQKPSRPLPASPRLGFFCVKIAPFYSMSIREKSLHRKTNPILHLHLIPPLDPTLSLVLLGSYVCHNADYLPLGLTVSCALSRLWYYCGHFCGRYEWKVFLDTERQKALFFPYRKDFEADQAHLQLQGRGIVKRLSYNASRKIAGLLSIISQNILRAKDTARRIFF